MCCLFFSRYSVAQLFYLVILGYSGYWPIYCILLLLVTGNGLFSLLCFIVIIFYSLLYANNTGSISVFVLFYQGNGLFSPPTLLVIWWLLFSLGVIPASWLVISTGKASCPTFSEHRGLCGRKRRKCWAGLLPIQLFGTAYRCWLVGDRSRVGCCSWWLFPSDK